MTQMFAFILHFAIGKLANCFHFRRFCLHFALSMLDAQLRRLAPVVAER